MTDWARQYEVLREMLQQTHDKAYTQGLADGRAGLREHPKHVCGLTGYNPMKDEPCPACAEQPKPALPLGHEFRPSGIPDTCMHTEGPMGDWITNWCYKPESAHRADAREEKPPSRS